MCVNSFLYISADDIMTAQQYFFWFFFNRDMVYTYFGGTKNSLLLVFSILVAFVSVCEFWFSVDDGVMDPTDV